MSKEKKTQPLSKNKCRVCNEKIVTMCFRGTGFCSQKCEKADRG